MQKNFIKAIIAFVPFSVAITLLIFFAYLLVQQNYRMNANDPQIQIAEDSANSLAHNIHPEFLNTNPETVDMSVSLAPYIIIFDKDGKPLAANVKLNGETPIPPAGVFDYAKTNGEDRISWQPQSGVRSAAIIKFFKSDSQEGYVLAGRSLKEVEAREDQAFKISILAWLGTILLTFIAFVIKFWLKEKI